ncbi:succinate dehydrogenase, hydrophobic membrane anchor protein [Dokdonella sp.]|uniref:succinate dehydrogenase, hydrophobic membrane anchor protein n=1 Tax=Dokdonella sp. TaxID=2291710 RepID=UPI002604F4DE|nr:succinate dehydrogenase, hydrophobic membrane anchor protein [Dokdonella sp.]
MSDLRTPLKNALGLGSAKQGAHHFLVQRTTAVALALLVPWVVWLVLEALHLDYAGAHALVAQPLNAVLLLAFVVAVFWHAQLGLQVVIEDYVHTKGTQVVLQILVKFLCFLGAAASALAVIRIALGR